MTASSKHTKAVTSCFGAIWRPSFCVHVYRQRNCTAQQDSERWMCGFANPGTTRSTVPTCTRCFLLIYFLTAAVAVTDGEKNRPIEPYLTSESSIPIPNYMYIVFLSQRRAVRGSRFQATDAERQRDLLRCYCPAMSASNARTEPPLRASH